MHGFSPSALGSLVRGLRSGYALRLDAAGVHVPGLEVVPWGAVLGVRQRVYERKGSALPPARLRRRAGLQRRLAASLRALSVRADPGLFGRRDTFVVPTQMLAIDPDALFAAAEAFLEAAAAKAQRRDNAVGAAQQRQLSGRRLP